MMPTRVSAISGISISKRAGLTQTLAGVAGETDLGLLVRKQPSPVFSYYLLDPVAFVNTLGMSAC